MKIADVFAQKDLEHTVLIGYYGGGNFGDELLLEVLMNLFKKRDVKSLTVTYQHLERYSTYHHEFNYDRIDMANKFSVFKAIFKNRNIVIGGGGLWGLDVNPNIFILSSLLFFSRFILGKKVYLLGVGYYNSTSRLGHISAWLAGKSSNHIVARDPESFQNFQKVTSNVSLDTDIAYNIPLLELKSYLEDFKKLDSRLRVTPKTIVISLRRFKTNQPNNFIKIIEKCLESNQDVNIIVATLEPQDVDPEGFALITSWQETYRNVQSINFSYNPMALVLFFRAHCRDLAFIGPQFHAIIAADLTEVPFFPLAYDNKVVELLGNITNQPIVPIHDFSEQKIQTFIDNFKMITS